MATHLNMRDEERWGFGDYVEEKKAQMDAPNDYNFSWKDLKRIGREYIQLMRGEEG